MTATEKTAAEPSDRDLILHVEDDADDALLIGRALRQVGVENPVKVVGNGEEARRFVLGEPPFGDRGEAPLPRLVLLDLNMPLVSGVEFLGWLRRQPRLRRIPVVVLTSSNAPADVAAAYDAGANGYLVKPLQHNDLVDTLCAFRSYWLERNQAPPRPGLGPKSDRLEP